MLGGSASLPLPAPPPPSSSRRYAPQCFVGEYASSPCDVSHRASDEPRRCMSLSSALAPSSLASPSIGRVFLRSFCTRRRPVSELNFRKISPLHSGRFCDIMFTSCESGAMAQRGEIQCAESQFALQSGRREKCRKFLMDDTCRGGAIALASLCVSI